MQTSNSSTAIQYAYDVCYPHEPFEISLLAGQSMELAIWADQLSSFDISCYFWCSANGEPFTSNSSKVDENIVQEIVSPFLKTDILTRCYLAIVI